MAGSQVARLPTRWSGGFWVGGGVGFTGFKASKQAAQTAKKYFP